MLMCYVRRTGLPVTLNQLCEMRQETFRHFCYDDVEIRTLLLTWSNKRCLEISDFKLLCEYYRLSVRVSLR